MKRTTLLALLLLPCMVWAQDFTLTLTGSATNYKVQQVSLYSGAPASRDTSRAALYIDGSHLSFLRFDLTELPANTTITGAWLYLYGVTSVPESWKVAPIGTYPNPDYPEHILAHMWWVQTPWSPATISWNNQPWFGDDLDINEQNLAVPSNGVPNYKLNMTSFVQGWVRKPVTNNGLVFYFEGANEKGLTNANFYSGQARPELQPRLVITYRPAPPPPICTYITALHGDLSGGYKQVEYRTSPLANDSSGAAIEASYWGDFFGDNWQNYTTRTIMRYDVSAVPTGSTVTSAKLYLYGKYYNHIEDGAPMAGNNVAYMEQVVRPWSPDTLNPTTHPAAVRTDNRVSIPASEDVMQDYVVNVTGLVQNWVNRPDSNFGMQLRMQNETQTAAMIFEGAQASPDKQPRLEICYTPAYNPLDSCTAGLIDSILPLDRKTHAFTAVLANNNSKPPARICWSFGDGSPDTCFLYDSTHPYTGAPVLHTYGNEYTSYAVSVRVLYQDSCMAAFSADTKVPSYCTAAFTDSAYANNGLRHAFTPSVTDNQAKKPVFLCWSFGDGVDSCFYYDSTHPYTGAPVVHSYLTALGRTVCMTVRYDDSCTASYCSDLKDSFLTSDSLCSVSIADSILTSGIGVHSFRPLLHSSNGRPAALICWSFGDGTDSCASYDTAHPYTGTPVVHAYPTLNSYQVTLTVIYADSCAATDRITVQSSQCSASITENTGGSSPEHQFILSASDNAQKSVVNVCWSLGDGTDTCQSYYAGVTDRISHTYAASGLYKACVTAYFQDGCAASSCKYANNVNCDSNKLVIHGNPTGGKYRQAVVTSGQGAGDTTQRSLVAVKNQMYYYNTNYLVRTMFRYDLSEIPDSAVVLSARLYLRVKDTVINESHSSDAYSGGNIAMLGEPWWTSNTFLGSYSSNGALTIGVPAGDVALDMTAFAQYWVSHPGSNYGAVLRTFPEDNEDALYVLNYYGGLAPDSLQPRLEVCYAVPYQPASPARMMSAAARTSPAAAAAGIQVSLYPNPAADVLHLQVQSSQAQAGAVYLYDMQGRLLQVLQQHTQFGKGFNTLHLPVNRRHVGPGIYLVRVQAGMAGYTYKVVFK